MKAAAWKGERVREGEGLTRGASDYSKIKIKRIAQEGEGLHAFGSRKWGWGRGGCWKQCNS